MNEATCDQSEAPRCFWCDQAEDMVDDPLIVLDLDPEGPDGPEYIHLRCARRNSQFGFCWCCGQSKVFYSDVLNDAGECDAHAGESVPDYPEEDAESFIENILNNV